MKEKTIWREVWDRGKWILILLAAFVLSQFPLGLSAWLTSRQFPLLQSGLCRFDCIHYWCTKNTTCYF